MTVHRGTDLGHALTQTMAQVNRQIDAVTAVAKELGCEPYEVRDAAGAFMLTPLLAAKAQILHSLVLLNQRRSTR